ncbi:hypothetical protein A1O3_09528 [Capronia epimyces CBS 606.96]|uniref:Arylformamidase n=1 Tax=Capronia epimyces CBS 606.96 TaxID=1182542 RepID=W9XD30_9EURO|nr:uncharacterized protein A1O3_09528 [Capronia epimyces CBS 606.96]EXJ78367.1 hypothetical protein A1O3_09528 [Capronia epimyces CBS 606.96]
MKRIIRYLQDQAIQVNQQQYSSAAYLSPPTKEPQQREHHHTHSPSSSYKASHTAHHPTRTEHPGSAAHRVPAHTSAADGSPEPSPPARAIPRAFNGDITRHQYAQDNILQSYEVYLPKFQASRLSGPNAQRYWVVYIHGGYFRDPALTSSSFYPALSQLVHARPDQQQQQHLPPPLQQEDNVTAYIAGYASINYRLSPHDQKAPQDPSKTSTFELRNARWPDHLYDVLTAIAHLQSKYGFGERYLLVGHSVGATMAVLSTLGRNNAMAFTTRERQDDGHGHGHLRRLPSIEPARAVLGVSGIYDFELLHHSFPSYAELTRNAIPDPEDNVLASPARYSAAEYLDTWVNRTGPGQSGGLDPDRDRDRDEQDEEKGKERTKKPDGTETKTRPRRALILAHSPDDGLVDWKQVEAMEAVFRKPGQDGGAYVAADSHRHSHGHGHDPGCGRGTDVGKDEVEVEVEVEVEGAVELKILKMSGRHNDIWAQGTELARVVREAVRVLRSLEFES